MNGDIPQEGFWYLHQLFSHLADGLDADLEGSRYDEEAVSPISINANKQDHKQAIYLISEVLEDELDAFNRLRTWEVDLGEREPVIENDSIKYFSSGFKDEIRFLTDSEEVSYDIYNNGKQGYRWDVLRKLVDGDTIQSALDDNYYDPSKKSNQAPYHQLHRKVLEDSELPETYREGLEPVLEQVSNPVGK